VASSGSSSVFAGFRFPREVISIAGRWYLRYGLSYRDVEELTAERGVTVEHVTIYRWVPRFTPESIEAARLCVMLPATAGSPTRHTSRWLAGGPICTGPSTSTARSSTYCCPSAVTWPRPGGSSPWALRTGTVPAEVTTDRVPAYPRVLDELIPSALHTVERYANNPVEADHGRLKARLRPMRGLKRHQPARTLAAGHAFVRNLRRGHYELATDVPDRHQLRSAFNRRTLAI
jgi:transposase, IS6 family